MVHAIFYGSGRGSSPRLGLKEIEARRPPQALNTAQARLGFPGPAWAGLGLRAWARTSLTRTWQGNGLHSSWGWSSIMAQLATFPIQTTAILLISKWNCYTHEYILFFFYVSAVSVGTPTPNWPSCLQTPFQKRLQPRKSGVGRPAGFEISWLVPLSWPIAQFPSRKVRTLKRNCKTCL